MAGHDRRCRLVRLASYNQAPFQGMPVLVRFMQFGIEDRSIPVFGERVQVNLQ